MDIKHQTGVTLIELMIVVAVISILAAIAYPSYRQSIIRSNRTEARNELNRYAGELEKCFTLFNVYNYNPPAPVTHNCKTLQTTLAGSGYLGQQRKYQITGVINTTNFTLTATPQGAQAADTECGNLTLTDTNVRGKSGTGTATACWK